MRKFAIILAVGLTGCPIFNKPNPPEPPPQEPLYDAACQALLDGGATFSNQCTGEKQYVHNPTQDPKHCELTPACPPEEPPTPPTPPPNACTVPAEGELTAADPQCPSGQFDDKVVEATTSIGDRRVPNSSPKEVKDAAAVENLRILAEQLRLRGFCAFDGSEAVFIHRSDGKWDEYHAVNFADAGWTYRGKYVGCHVGSGTTPTPPPTPPPSNGTDPSTLEARFTIKLQYPASCRVDTTFQVHGRDFCNSIGFTGREWCPVAQEGDPDRQAKEVAIIGVQKFWCDGQVEPALENPAQTKCCGYVKTCTENLKTCSEKQL